MFILNSTYSKFINLLSWLFLALICYSCGGEFPPGGKPIEVTRNYDGINFKMTIGRKSYSGVIECSGQPAAKDICAEFSNYRVLVYVETDKLYIHPYYGSYSTISEDGSWRISKVDRTPPPRAVYAFLVKSEQDIPNQIFNKDELSYLSYVEWFEK